MVDTKYHLRYVDVRDFIKGEKVYTKSLARNLGIQLSKNDYILLIDADMIPHPNLLQNHVKKLSHLKNKNVVLVGLELRTLKQDEYLKVKDLIFKVQTADDLEKIFHFDFSNRSRKILKFRKIGWYKFLTGNLLSTRELFIKTGMFDTDFVSYGFEDLELGYRFEKLGAMIFFNPSSLTIHLHPLPIDKRVKNKIDSVKNLKIFYQKYQNKEILQKLGINFYSKIIYNYFPGYIKELLKKKSNDYLTNYFFWKEWNTRK